MGRKSNAKQQRRRTASFTVLCPGILEVLSVGKGDLKIEVGDSNKDRADAQRLIEEMLRKGYTLFAETGDGLLKVRKFDPDRMVYIVADTPGVAPEPDQPDAEPSQSKAKRKPREVPVRDSRATVIGRTAGG